MADERLVAIYKEKLLYAPDFVLPEGASDADREAYAEAKGVPVDPPMTAKEEKKAEKAKGKGKGKGKK